MNTVFRIFLLFCNISFRSQCLCAQHSSAGCASDCIVGKTDELIVKHRILSQPAMDIPIPILIIHIQSYLGTIVILQILDELLRCAGKSRLLQGIL